MMVFDCDIAFTFVDSRYTVYVVLDTLRAGVL